MRPPKPRNYAVALSPTHRGWGRVLKAGANYFLLRLHQDDGGPGPVVRFSDDAVVYRSVSRRAAQQYYGLVCNDYLSLLNSMARARTACGSFEPKGKKYE